MSQSFSDDARLRATEAQMRRALGLQEQAPTPDRGPPVPTNAGTAHPHRRHFVRDGEVPVTVVHRDNDNGAGSNKLDAARQALKEQTAAREQAEQLLQEARATIQDLQTKLAHERIARDESLRRLADERQIIEDELATERARRQQAEQARDETIAKSQRVETANPTRRRGRPAKISEPESEIVEWWVPGWKERLG
jgi:hypothetical protein